jgi:putative selenium metabolism hydrolase
MLSKEMKLNSSSMQALDMSAVTRKVHALAHDLNSDMIRFLGDLIRIRSYTGQERPAVERMLTELTTIGCDAVWMDSAGNAIARIGTGSRVLLYNAHLDTNEVTDEREWPHPPLEPVIENDSLFGLGASDCKAGVAAIVYGAAILKKLGLMDDFSLIIMGATLEEDAEGFALRSLVERDGLRPDAVLLAEATDLTLRRGHRGRCEIRVRTTGRAAHASVPEQGENAILKMIPVLQALKDMQPDLPFHPIFGKGTQVVSLIEGPHTPNSVPDWCEITLDRRLVPGENANTILEGIRSIVEPFGATASIPFQKVRTHTGLNLDGPGFYPGWLLPENDPLIQNAQAALNALWGQPGRLDIWKFSTDGTYSAGVAGIPTLGFGPQEECFVHTPFDQVNLNKLKSAAMFYALFPLFFMNNAD